MGLKTYLVKIGLENNTVSRALSINAEGPRTAFTFIMQHHISEDSDDMIVEIIDTETGKTVYDWDNAFVDQFTVSTKQVQYNIVSTVKQVKGKENGS